VPPPPMTSPATAPAASVASASGLDRFLNLVERVGNRLPDPAILFVIALLLVWAASAVLAPIEFTEIDRVHGDRPPQTGCH
jgi:aminobenzoyl-glutamate transport protein